jgi:tungstate transport system ATP-binding protein
MTSSRFLLELRDLKVDRGGVRVLDIPSFHLRENEFVSLVGPNGSGKSTLLLSMMCLLERAGGSVLWRGSEVGTARAALALRRRIAMVLQEPLLFDASVEDNVAAGLKLRKLPRAQVRRRVATYLERFSLGHMAQRSARKLSGGEARRVSLARALALEPDVIFLDEPFISLDPPTRQSITHDLEVTIRDTRTAAILVSHEASESLRLSDRIVVMEAGRIVQADAPTAVMNRPVNEFVVRWFGMETLLAGVVTESVGGKLRVSIGGTEIEARGTEPAGEEVYCCIGPEKVSVHLEEPASVHDGNVFPGRIVSTSSMGPFLKLTLDCGFRLVTYVPLDLFARLELRERSEVVASFEAAAVRVLVRSGEGASDESRASPTIGGS